jgi:molecular chaperone GrpE
MTEEERFNSTDPAEAAAESADSADPALADATSRGSSAPAAPVTADWKELYLRAVAELDNYRKRGERDRSAQVQFAAESVIRKILEPVESLDRALATLEALEREVPEAQRPPLSRSLDGLRALRRQFHAVLDSEGVEAVGKPGVEFDPALHEALATVPSDTYPEGTVSQVFSPGYTLRGRLVRPARVAVSSGPLDHKTRTAGGSAEGSAQDSHNHRRRRPTGTSTSSPEATPPGSSKINETE